jgi:hypothetical protein
VSERQREVLEGLNEEANFWVARYREHSAQLLTNATHPVDGTGSTTSSEKISGGSPKENNRTGKDKRGVLIAQTDQTSRSEDVARAPDSIPVGAGSAQDNRNVERPRRKPDFQSSWERLDLVNALAMELATIKQDLRRFYTAEDLKLKHPQFVLWEHLDKAEVKELADGAEFAPRAYAENLTLSRFGITSRETLKKDRKKLRQAQRAKPKRVPAVRAMGC